MSNKYLAIGLSLIAGLALSTSTGFCNAPPHYYVLPGTCVPVEGGSATATYTPVDGKPGLSLFNDSFFPFSSYSEFVYESIDQNNLPTNFAIPQGNFSFDLINSSTNVESEFLVIGYYDNGTAILFDSFPNAPANGRYTVNTVRNLGALRRIGFLYTAAGGTVIVSNFQNNARPTGVAGINHDIGCLPLPIQQERKTSR